MTETANENLDDAKRINAQLSMPVTEDNRSLPINATAIGPFIGNTIPYKAEESEEILNKPTIRQPIRVINTPGDIQQYSELADQNGDNINMYDYQLSPELANKIKDRHNTVDAGYLTGNPAAKLSFYFHELAHYNREHKGIDHISNGNAETNLTLNYVDEKSAYVTQNIALVNIYNQCKNSGAEYFIYPDVKIKTDELLDMYPNLRECIEKNGSDLTDKNTLIAISKNAAKNWDELYFQSYQEIAFADDAIESNCSLMEQIQAAKDGNKAMSEQLKDIDIGYGMHIDLPDECKSFIYPDKTWVKDFIIENKEGYHPSNEGLLAIDAYLESRGLKTNKAKDAYIREQHEKIVNRTADADAVLKDLMLNADMNPDNDRSIYYADNLLEKKENGTLVVRDINSGDNTFYPVTQDSTRLSQQLQTQTGKYPPDTPTPEIAAQRTLAELKMSNACTMNEYRQEKAAQAPSEPQPEKATPAISNNLILANASKQSSR